MNSMTGYGRGEAGAEGLSISVEIRSVNSRFRDVHLRLPRGYAALEPRIKALLKGRFARGRLDVTVHRAGPSGGEVHLDAGLALRTHRALSELAALLPGEHEVPLALVAEQPGVLSVVDSGLDADAEWPVVEAALRAAADRLAEMRAAEGAALRADLAGHLEALGALRRRVAAASDVTERLRARLSERLSRLLEGGPIDPARVAQEAAVLADKADVSEELARMESHLSQAAEALEAAEPVGRRLEFLAQELHREINTCGSKAADLGLSRLVVEMKSVLERVREQVANIE